MPVYNSGLMLDDTGYTVQEYVQLLASGQTAAPEDRPKYGGTVVADAPRRRSAALAPERPATPAARKIGLVLGVYQPELARLLGDF